MHRKSQLVRSKDLRAWLKFQWHFSTILASHCQGKTISGVPCFWWIPVSPEWELSLNKKNPSFTGRSLCLPLYFVSRNTAPPTEPTAKSLLSLGAISLIPFPSLVGAATFSNNPGHAHFPRRPGNSVPMSRFLRHKPQQVPIFICHQMLTLKDAESAGKK